MSWTAFGEAASSQWRRKLLHWAVNAVKISAGAHVIFNYVGFFSQVSVV